MIQLKQNALKIESFLTEKVGYQKKAARYTLDQLPELLFSMTEKEALGLIDLKKKVLRNPDTSIMPTKTTKEVTRKPRILYLDIETSPNLVMSWGTGEQIISHDSVVQERAIICICWKWSDETKVHSIAWNHGDDREVCKVIAPIIDACDAISGHNLKQFDLKWIRTRCLLHGIYFKSKINVIDTLTIARSNFKFNSNKLDYISKFLGSTGKTSTSFGMWKNILLNNDKKDLQKMVDYCKNDVLELETMHKKLTKMIPDKEIKLK